MGKLTHLRTEPTIMRSVHRRDETLGFLLPKILGILWEKGRTDAPHIPGDIKAIPGDVVATIDDDLGIGAAAFGAGRFYIHAYGSTDRVTWTKLFSAHLGDHSVVDPAHFPYWNGHCGILSWKRGPWEDKIIAQQITPRSFAHLMTAGLLVSTQRD